ncbi:anti-sigma factor [Crossiella sp. CA-258035]|uniref:anti-sigma factor n=1 Tax=Crossiella sp. CA-258035 TaxID=2981138 RepID=UPI0024BCCFF8|nr:anti-sigma factor [Crossiella sp. CA-258035]WHT22678.1 anti-sigma factor [Crossiella sp. CA-258035]
MNTPADVHALTGAYVLNALSPAEREQFEQHLHLCPTCALEVTEFTETSAWLANFVAEAPPPALRERVLATVECTPQNPPLASSPRPGANRRGRRALLVAAAAAVAGMMVLGLHSTAPSDQLDRQGVALSGGVGAGALLASADARVLSAPGPGGGTLSVVHAPSHAAAVLIARGMPAPPAEHVYQAWVIGPNGARSAGLLSATAPLVAHGVAPGDRIGLTVEPTGGSRQPTSLPVITTALPPA